MCFSMTAVGNQSCDDYETDVTRGVFCTWIVPACSTRGTKCGAVGSVCSTAAGFLESDFEFMFKQQYFPASLKPIYSNYFIRYFITIFIKFMLE